jgi:hypothetical protein
MKTPTLKLTFVRHAYTKKEGKLETIASFPLARHPEHEGLWVMAARENVIFPTGDVLNVYSEINPSCNYVHIYHGERRMVSWKATGDVELMFLLPNGEEAYVSLAENEAAR